MVVAAGLGLVFLASNRGMSRLEGGISLTLYAAYMGFIFSA
jgi:hypothetical protein